MLRSETEETVETATCPECGDQAVAEAVVAGDWFVCRCGHEFFHKLAPSGIFWYHGRSSWTAFKRQGEVYGVA